MSMFLILFLSIELCNVTNLVRYSSALWVFVRIFVMRDVPVAMPRHHRKLEWDTQEVHFHQSKKVFLLGISKCKSTNRNLGQCRTINKKKKVRLMLGALKCVLTENALVNYKIFFFLFFTNLYIGPNGEAVVEKE